MREVLQYHSYFRQQGTAGAVAKELEAREDCILAIVWDRWMSEEGGWVYQVDAFFEFNDYFDEKELAGSFSIVHLSEQMEDILRSIG